jgi:hypothetical protein
MQRALQPTQARTKIPRFARDDKLGFLDKRVFPDRRVFLACIRNELALGRVVLQFAVQSCFADAEQAGGLQFVSIEFGDGVEDGQPL